VGVLSKVGSGESKLCYALTKADGRKMAVILGGYRTSLHVPDDPRLSMVSDSDTQVVWEYSDLKAYAMLPMSSHFGIKLQEFGEERTRSQAVLGTSVLARRRARRYIDALPASFRPEDKAAAVKELNHPRHYLAKPGFMMPVVIDIPVAEITHLRYTNKHE